MKNTIYLKDFTYSDIICFGEIKAGEDSLIALDAFNYHKKNNVRYNCKNGKTYSADCPDGVYSEFVHESDIPAYDCKYDILQDAFMGLIKNSISRVKRGYSL